MIYFEEVPRIFYQHPKIRKEGKVKISDTTYFGYAVYVFFDVKDGTR
jgi:hypothetical protein